MDNPPDDGPCEVTITAPERDWLQTFCRALIEDHVAAAAHLDVMHTTYRWAGEVHEADEARARIHTTGDRVPEIADRVLASHAFEVPCVISTPIKTGSTSYLQWVVSESTNRRA